MLTDCYRNYSKRMLTCQSKFLKRYAFLQEPKTVIGKLVSGAWRQFKSWWDEHKRPQVEESTRDSVRSRLADFKKQVEESKKTKSTPTKRKGIDR